MAGLRSTSLFNDANLQAYYEFESGALTTDSKGTNTLTNNNSVASNVGKFGGGADSSTASNEYFSITGSATAVWGLNNASSWTVSIWFKLNAEISAGNQYLFYWQQGNANNDVDNFAYYDFNGGTRRLVITRNRNGAATDQFTSTQTLGTSSWHNLVVTYDGTTLTAYLDNASIGSVASTGTGSANLTTAKGNVAGDGSGLNGLQAIYDDVSVFNRALSSAEVTVIWNSPIGGGYLGKAFW